MESSEGGKDMKVQLDIRDFLRFPWLCDNAEIDTDQTPEAFED